MKLLCRQPDTADRKARAVRRKRQPRTTLADDGASNEFVRQCQRIRSRRRHDEVFVLCAKIEEEISDLDEADKKEFLAELGVDTSGLDRLIAASYKLLGLNQLSDRRSAGIAVHGPSPRAPKAPQAAGKIHSDFERGFIRAEVVAL